MIQAASADAVGTFAGIVFACIFFTCLSALCIAGTVWVLVRILPPRERHALKLPWRKTE